VPALTAGKRKTLVPAGSDDDDMSDEQEILNRHGIR
jgi:hypothetical protein